MPLARIIVTAVTLARGWRQKRRATVRIDGSRRRADIVFEDGAGGPPKRVAFSCSPMGLMQVSCSLRRKLRIAARTVRMLLVATATTGMGTAPTAHAEPPRFVEVAYDGQVVTGLQLIQQSNLYLLLGVDGQLHRWPASPPQQSIRTVNGRFEPEAAVQMRGKLAREFGPNMEVVATKHYLVVQPKGRGKHWPDLFEKFHREFLQQMLRRGVEVRRGRFPMVAVVFADRSQFQQEMGRQKRSLPNVVGVYVNSSNRIFTFDAGYQESTAEVLRHEAAHQSAFNCNVHSRLTPTPSWISEGLGMMFEPAAMTRADTIGTDAASSRIHRQALRQLRGRYADGTQSLAYDVNRLIRDDQMFSDSGDEVAEAYAVAWLMMFYLAERRPTVFAALLNHTTARPPLHDYPTSQRVADFERITGRSISDNALEIRAFLRSMEAGEK